MQITQAVNIDLRNTPFREWPEQAREYALQFACKTVNWNFIQRLTTMEKFLYLAWYVETTYNLDFL